MKHAPGDRNGRPNLLLLSIVLLVALLGAVLLLAPKAHAATPAPTCPGDTGTKLGIWWDFNESPGSQTFHEAHGDPKYDLAVEPGYARVTATGAAVVFNNDSLLTTRTNIFDPENAQTIIVCVKYRTDDHDSYNLWQIGNSSPGCATQCMLKVTGWYGQVIAPRDGFRVTTGVDNVAGDGKYHWVTYTRHGDTWRVYFDGGLKDTKVRSNIGPVHLTSRMALGGKITRDGITSSHDLLLGRVAFLGLGAR